MYALERFSDAQEKCFSRVCYELSQGRKQTHWMWFIFPQLKGLGRSATAQYYAISGLEEARAFLRHPVLSDHLTAVVSLLLKHSDKTPIEIFGTPDNLKLHSSLTLFEKASESLHEKHLLFGLALDTFFNGDRDATTLAILDNYALHKANAYPLNH